MTDIIEPPEVDDLPDAPNRGDPAPVFSADAAAFTGAMPLWGTQMVALAAATYQNALATFEAATEIAGVANLAAASTDMFGRSTSTLTVDPGTKTIRLTDPAVGFAVNDQVVIVLRADPAIRMLGTIATFDGSDDMTVTVVSGGVFGSGEFSSWIVMSAAFLGDPSSAVDLWEQTSEVVAITPKTFKDAKVFQTLSDGATVTPNGALGRNFNWTIAGNRTLAAITNCAPGDTFLIKITQDGTGSRILAWSSGVYKRAGGLPVLSTAAGAVDYLQLKVIAVDGSNVATLVLATFAKAPTGT
jgi:hypothetical protein